MEIACLSMSYNMVDKHVDVIQEIVGSLSGNAFILETSDKKLTDILVANACKYTVFYPLFAKFKKKVDAYADRAIRMVEYATQCYCLIEKDDKSMGPLIVAMEFKKQHPRFLLVIILFDGDTHKTISLEEAKEVFKWDT